MTKITTLAALMLLAGCTKTMQQEKMVVDQCLRQELFMKCLSVMPKGPTHVGTSNDWDEAINACEDAAYWQAKRQRQFVKPECGV